MSVNFSCDIVLQLPITGRVQLFHCALEPVASGLLIDIAPARLPRWLYHHIISLHRIFPNDVYMYHNFFTLKKIISLYSIFFTATIFLFLFLPYYGRTPQNSYLNFCQQFLSSHSTSLDVIPFRLYVICSPNLSFLISFFLSLIDSALAIMFSHAIP